MKKQVCMAMLVAAWAVGCAAPSGGRGSPPSGSGPEGGEGRGQAQGQGVCRAPVDQVQEQLAETALALKLTPKQLVLWEAYQASVGSLMSDQIKREVYSPPTRSAVQQVNGKVDVVRNRLTAMEEIAERGTVLYQSLDDAQKKVADLRLAATVPPLYSGLICQGGGDSGQRGERGGPGQGGRGGPGGMGGGSGGGGMGRF